MDLKFYNTLTKKVEKFVPIKKGKVRMYVCGPTVNDVPHLGHARMQIFFDVFRKYLIYSGYAVKFVSNVTDIEDKIIAKADSLGISVEELAKNNELAHEEDYVSLGVSPPDVQPHATEYVSEMVDLISRLEKNGFTYVVDGNGVYFEVSKFDNYGKLSNINLAELRSSRKLKSESMGKEKKNSKDFVLWKFSKDGEPSWKSPWGDGRPGWHIECSAMNYAVLGLPIDIHGGGQDLIFPHHEDEIAQSEAGYGKKFCNYWVHNGMVNIDKVKMSKSLGNFKTVRDLFEEGFSGEDIRYFVLNAHYRKPIDFSFDKLNEAKTSLKNLKNLISNLSDDEKINDMYLTEWESCMNDDLNTAGALNVLWKLVRDKDADGKISTIKKIDEVFGLKLMEEEEIAIPREVKNLVDEREKARKEKDWKRADELREEIREAGFEISDGKKRWELKKV